MNRIPVIEEERCIGCRACVEACPEVFAFSESLGWAFVLYPEGAEAEKIQAAIDLCPTQCISWAE